MKLTKNYENHKLEHLPEIGSTVWLWDDGATSRTVHDVRQGENGLEISLGLYFLNEAGEVFQDKNDLYANECAGRDIQTFTGWGFSEKHLREIWHKASDISYPNERQIEQRFSFPMPYKMLLDEISELKEGGNNGMG